ncbi:MAG: A/G-specific adenine glycosylase [Acidithiobacillus sp.]
MILLAEPLLEWYAQYGRHDLPWRQTRDSYRLWLAEIMLQQTQVESVKPYYQRFLEVLPSWEALANAPQDQVLALWSGLGYYARARNAQRTAQMVLREFGGFFPDNLVAAESLPGVGRSTAAAILASAFDQQQAILDANARRVLIRTQAIQTDPKATATLRQLWSIATLQTPPKAHDYNQAIQDLGAMICTPRRPRCEMCPLSSICRAYDQGLTDCLPLVSGKTPKPQRCAFFLLIEDEAGQILLEKRPNSGIWGGLWCLPQVNHLTPTSCKNVEEDLVDSPILHAQMEQICLQDFGLSVEVQTIKPVQRHVFTHFQLYFRCVNLRVRENRVADQAIPAGHWYLLEDALKTGLPSPIRQILHAQRA